MFAVLFEVVPKAERYDEYLSIAAGLRPELLASPGFRENTRYASRARAGLLLSLSLWDDEKALIRWRTHAGHHAAQARGRSAVLDHYRLRVGEVIAHSADDIGSGRSRLDTTDVGAAKAVVVIDGPEPAALSALQCQRDAIAADSDCLEAITEPGRFLALQGFGAEAAALAAVGNTAPSGRRIAIRIIRDYGMDDRREAVQWMA